MISVKPLKKQKEIVLQVTDDTIGFKKEFSIGLVDDDEIWIKNGAWKIGSDLEKSEFLDESIRKAETKCTLIRYNSSSNFTFGYLVKEVFSQIQYQKAPIQDIMYLWAFRLEKEIGDFSYKCFSLLPDYFSDFVRYDGHQYFKLNAKILDNFNQYLLFARNKQSKIVNEVNAYMDMFLMSHPEIKEGVIDCCEFIDTKQDFIVPEIKHLIEFLEMRPPEPWMETYEVAKFMLETGLSRDFIGKTKINNLSRFFRTIHTSRSKMTKVLGDAQLTLIKHGHELPNISNERFNLEIKALFRYAGLDMEYKTILRTPNHKYYMEYPLYQLVDEKIIQGSFLARCLHYQVDVRDIIHLAEIPDYRMLIPYFDWYNRQREDYPSINTEEVEQLEF